MDGSTCTLRTPDLAPLAARKVRVALPPAERLDLSSLASSPGTATGTDTLMKPCAPFVMVTSAVSPAFRRTASLSNLTWFIRKSAVVGMLEREGGAAAAPLAGYGPGVIVPKGVWRRASGSTYQNHWSFSTFQVLIMGTFIGWSMKPGIITYCSHTTTAFALVKFSKYSTFDIRSEEHTSELQSLRHLVCRLLLE